MISDAEKLRWLKSTKYTLLCVMSFRPCFVVCPCFEMLMWMKIALVYYICLYEPSCLFKRGDHIVDANLIMLAIVLWSLMFFAA